jgi:hypothetical protein
MMTFLLGGVPQLISHWHVDEQMEARCIETVEAGVVLRAAQISDTVGQLLVRLMEGDDFKPSTVRFSSATRPQNHRNVADQIVHRLATILDCGVNNFTLEAV